MNANELADMLEVDSWYKLVTREEIATMLRQQQAVIEDLEKENTDLRYLIATKLEQQDGISLNSMAHPITNTPEPSYEIDSDKLETIEIDLPSPEPVAWAVWEGRPHDLFFTKEDADELCRLKGGDAKSVPLYTHPVKEQDTECQYCKQGCIRCDARKQLTDEEITACIDESEPDTTDMIRFARAILRKAQEK